MLICKFTTWESMISNGGAVSSVLLKINASRVDNELLSSSDALEKALAISSTGKLAAMCDVTNHAP